MGLGASSLLFFANVQSINHELEMLKKENLSILDWSSMVPKDAKLNKEDGSILDLSAKVKNKHL